MRWAGRSRRWTHSTEYPTAESRSALRTILGDACVMAGDERAVAVLERPGPRRSSRGEVWWLAETIRLLAEAVAVAGDPERAVALAEEAEVLAIRQGARMLLPRLAETRQRLTPTRPAHQT